MKTETRTLNIKMIIWWNFGVPEFRHIEAMVTRLKDGYYRIESTDKKFYDGRCLFAKEHHAFVGNL